jgi:DNA-binding HxlR family transcriptional regulator
MYGGVRAVLGPKWSLEVLDLLSAEGPLNFTDIERAFETSTDVITRRLRLLEEHGLIERTARSSRDVRYAITEDGRAVLDRAAEIANRLAE